MRDFLWGCCERINMPRSEWQLRKTLSPADFGLLSKCILTWILTRHHFFFVLCLQPDITGSVLWDEAPCCKSSHWSQPTTVGHQRLWQRYQGVCSPLGMVPCGVHYPQAVLSFLSCVDFCVCFFKVFAHSVDLLHTNCVTSKICTRTQRCCDFACCKSTLFR